MVARRKQTGSSRSADAAGNKENEVKCTQGFQQQMLDHNRWGVHVKVEKKHSAAESPSEQDDCSTLSEVGCPLTVQSAVVLEVLHHKTTVSMFCSSRGTIAR